MYIGFNLQKADDLVEAIIKDYNSLGQYTAQEWETLKNVLRKEWIGPDEQAFEINFVNRLCDLNVKAYDLANNCIKTIGNTTDKWIKFQNNNTVDGSINIYGLTTNLTNTAQKLVGYVLSGCPSLKKNDSIIVFKPRTDININTNRGLRNSSSKATIQAAVADFVKTVQARTQQLFDSIQTNKAFYGDQSSLLKNYIMKTGESIGIVTTSVKDLSDALDRLASSAYTSTQNSVKSVTNQGARTLDNMTNSLGKSRWV